MRRRGFVKALAAIPAAPALMAQQTAPAQAPAAPSVRPPSEELPVLTPSVPDAAGEMTPKFFTPVQLSTLRRVSDLLMPALNGTPGALDAKAAEFLDFLIGESPADRQRVYKDGLDALNAQSVQQFKKPFAELEAPHSDVLLAALRKPWTFEEPSDSVATFLRMAKQDVRTATVNSREYSATATTGGGRRFGGGGLYWYPLD
jgi:hypothetical protein